MPQLKDFKDISITFGKHPNTADVLVVKNENAIKQSLMNLVSTLKGERPFNFEIGSRIQNLLFENMDYGLAAIIAEEIQMLISNYEPRVMLRDVSAVPDYDANCYSIVLEYVIRGRELPDDGVITTEFFLERTR